MQSNELVEDGSTSVPQPKKGSFFKDVFLIIFFAIVISTLMRTFLFQVFFIPSESMVPTLNVGDEVIVNKLYPDKFAIERGDVVVFKDPGGWLEGIHAKPVNPALEPLVKVGLLPHDSQDHLIKRVIGLPGDTVEVPRPGGALYVNGKVVNEPYVPHGTAASATEFKVIVPDGHVWVMGDNRENSSDSRYHSSDKSDASTGSVPMDNIEGKALVVNWTIANWKVLNKDNDNSNITVNVG